MLNKLKNLVWDDPFLTKSSIDLAQFLNSNKDVGFRFSVDVQDLFYSVPQDQLLLSVKECIEENGDVCFQNSAGLSIDNFLALLQFYLNSTFNVFDKQPFLQRSGICTGSCVAPILSDILLTSKTRLISFWSEFLKGGRF